MGLFAKVAPEVKQAYDLLEEAKVTLASVNPSLLQDAISEARKSLTISRQDTDEFIKEIRDNHKSIKEWVYTYLINDAADKMESGRYHVYRGVLDFTGEALKDIFEKSIKVMIEMGAYTKEWADKNIRDPVYSSIKKVG
jgi:hypothetical protein